MDPLDVAERFAPGAQYIDGQLRTGTSGSRHTVVDPATGEGVYCYQLAGPAEVDDAVAAARAALPEWAGATPVQRSAALRRLAGLLAAQAGDFAYTESLQCGKPLKLSEELDVPGAIDSAWFSAGVARHLPDGAPAGYGGPHAASVRREPLGVIGAIAPWHHPLRMAAWKVLPAIAAGNTVVLKPSGLTPLTALMLAQAATAAGLPPGVVNVVTGSGPTTGECLVGHPDVAMASFTGSTATGRRVAQLAAAAAPRVKRLHLELGGKAPFLVFDDADLAAAVHGAVAGALLNAGQDRAAATCAYVQRPLFHDFVNGVADLMEGIRLGDPFEPGTDLGPLISLAHRERVAGYVGRARADHATVVTGGAAPDFAAHSAVARGAYYRPTLITGAAPDGELVRGEVFGPVLAVLPFDADDDGLAMANAFPRGPAASVWSRDVYRTGRATRELAAACVWVNDHLPAVGEMSRGGIGTPDAHGDTSFSAFEEYTFVKHVMYDTTAVARKDWHRTVFGTRTSRIAPAGPPTA